MSELLQLNPKGVFIIAKKNDEVAGSFEYIKGRFSMYVLDRFCEEKKIENYLSLLEKVISGMKVGDYADLILLAVNDYYRNVPNGSGRTRQDVMDLIDEVLDGISSKDFSNLISHAIGRVASLKVPIDTSEVNKVTPEEAEEKKRDLSKNLTDTNSVNAATSAE